MARRSHTSIGPMSARSAHVPHFIPQKQDFAPSDRVTNANTTGAYSQEQAWRGCVIPPARLAAFSLPSLQSGKRIFPKLIVGQNSATAESAPSELLVGEIAQEALDA